MVLYVVEMARWWDVCVYNGTIGHSHRGNITNLVGRNNITYFTFKILYCTLNGIIMKGGAIIPQTDSSHPPPRQVKAVQNIQPPLKPPRQTVRIPHPVYKAPS